MTFCDELPEAPSVAALHESALRVLERTGVLVQDDEAVALLRAHGVRCDGNRVFITEDQVHQALATVPSSFVLAGRRPELGLPLGGADGRIFGSASGPAFILESAPGGSGAITRPGTLADLQATAKLGHVLSAIDYNSDCIEPMDLPEEARTRVGTYARLTLSDKAIEWISSTEADVDESERINEIVFGAGWDQRPRALTILNTTAPLLVSAETARILIRWARRGQPVCMASCVMGGTTGPATLAGVLAVQHAEVLSTMVLGQAAREGSPFVYGGLPAMASLRTGAARFAGPEFVRLSVATAQLAHLCGLPVRAGAASTDAHSVDARAMAESAEGLSAAVFAGAHFLFQAAGIMSSFNALSLEKYVLDADLITALRAAVDPIRAGEEESAEDVIHAVGPGAGYLGQAHTRRHARDFEGGSRQQLETFEQWASAGSEPAVAVATRRVGQLLEAHQPPDDLDEVTLRQLRDYCLA
jgi:trimethylamine---corrinoid protein Co-methyltransferase